MPARPRGNRGGINATPSLAVSSSRRPTSLSHSARYSLSVMLPLVDQSKPAHNDICRILFLHIVDRGLVARSQYHIEACFRPAALLHPNPLFLKFPVIRE